MPRTTLVLSNFLLCLLLAGCGSKPSNFFVLSAPASIEGAPIQTTSRTGISIGVGPVTLPEYLDRSEIVIRKNITSLDVASLDRWGGDLAVNFQGVLGEAISENLNTDRTLLYPWQVSGQVTHQILVQVGAFEAWPGGYVLLDARWTVVDGRTQEVRRMGRSLVREPIGGSRDINEAPDYAQIAAAMSRSVARLGTEIANNGIR